MTLDWDENAEAEFVEAAVYYEKKGEGLGERFIAAHQPATGLLEGSH